MRNDSEAMAEITAKRQSITVKGCAVNTVRSHLATGISSAYEQQKKRPSKLAAYTDYLREWQALRTPQKSRLAHWRAVPWTVWICLFDVVGHCAFRMYP